MQSKIFFITGVPGSGKSTVCSILRSRLGSGYEVRDFDERGVPDNVDVQWRANETAHWVTVGAANRQKGIVTVICGFAVPNEVRADDGARFILLDLSEGVLRERLLKRYSVPENVRELQRMTGKTVQASIEENEGSVPWLRNLCAEYGVKSIDTSEKTQEQVCEEIERYILSESR